MPPRPVLAALSPILASAPHKYPSNFYLSVDLHAHTHSRGPRWEWMIEQKHVLPQKWLIKFCIYSILKLIGDWRPPLFHFNHLHSTWQTFVIRAFCWSWLIFCQNNKTAMYMFLFFCETNVCLQIRTGCAEVFIMVEQCQTEKLYFTEDIYFANILHLLII